MCRIVLVLAFLRRLPTRNSGVFINEKRTNSPNKSKVDGEHPVDPFQEPSEGVPAADNHLYANRTLRALAPPRRLSPGVRPFEMGYRRELFDFWHSGILAGRGWHSEGVVNLWHGHE